MIFRHSQVATAERQRDRRALVRLEALGGDPDQRLFADEFEALQVLVVRHQRDFDRAGVNQRAEFDRILADDGNLDQRMAAVEDGENSARNASA